MAQMFDIGDTVELSVSFANASGQATDPTAVALRVRDPDGDETTPAIVHNAGEPGEYSAVLPLTAAGTWLWRWEGTGAVGAAAEGTIPVRHSAFVTG